MLLQALFLNVHFILIWSVIVLWNWYIWCFSFVILNMLSNFGLHFLYFLIILLISFFLNFVNFFDFIIIAWKIFYLSLCFGLGFFDSSCFFFLSLVYWISEFSGQLLSLTFNVCEVTLVRLVSLSLQGPYFILYSGVNLPLLIFAQYIFDTSISVLFLYAFVRCSTSHWSTNYNFYRYFYFYTIYVLEHISINRYML